MEKSRPQISVNNVDKSTRKMKTSQTPMIPRKMKGEKVGKSHPVFYDDRDGCD